MQLKTVINNDANMNQTFTTIDEYINSLSVEDRVIITQLRTLIKSNLPVGFQEQINYNMLGYVVPHSIYTNGYHCTPELPLPFINLAAQKNFIALYHMGIIADQELRTWFEAEYPKHCKTKLNMGKSCIRFKRNAIPYELIAQLISKMSVSQWIVLYEHNYIAN